MAIANNQLLLKMSPTLQGETLWRINGKWLRRVRFLNGTQPEFIAKVMLSLEPLVFSPSESIFGNQLYILHHGMAVYGGKVIGGGGVWGEDMLIYYQSLRLRCFAKAISYVEAFSITRDTLLSVSENFPISHRKIRGYIGWLAFRRMLVVISKREMAMRATLGLTDVRSPYLNSVFAHLDQKTAAIDDNDPFASFAVVPTTATEGGAGAVMSFDNIEVAKDGLRITAVCAEGLAAADANGLSDPYASLVISTRPKVKHKTKSIKKTLSPVWDQVRSPSPAISRHLPPSPGTSWHLPCSAACSAVLSSGIPRPPMLSPSISRHLTRSSLCEQDFVWDTKATERQELVGGLLEIKVRVA